MKKYILAIASLMVGCQGAYAFNLVDDVKANTKLTAIDGFGPAYYYSAVKGSDGSSQAGFNDQVFTYRDILTCNIGWTNSLNGKDVGSAVGGPGLKIDSLLAILWPWAASTIRSVPSLQKFLDAKFINAYGGWRTDTVTFDYGYATGLQIKF